MIRKIFSVFLIGVMLFTSRDCLYAMGTPPPHKYIPLRVMVYKGEKFTLRIKGDYKIVDFGKAQVLKEGRNLKTQTLSAREIHSEGMKILAEDRSRIYINRRQFRGNIDIIKLEDTKLLVINHIDLEEYLYGVLFHEVSHRWPMEVLKAQAVAARTYALYQKLVSKSKYYDLSSDIYSQVYGGRRSETWRTTKAVNLTLGLVLTYNGKVFPAYYHATCGGRTSDVTSLWNIDVPALGVKECNFCQISPHYRWKRELTLEDIQNKIKEGGHDIEPVSFEILKRDEASRILELEIIGKGGSVRLSGNKFRLLVGPNVIRSANFEIQQKGRYVTFQGKGWGHGIGMCQWGAYGMAKGGWDVEEILGYYYPGAEISRVE